MYDSYTPFCSRFMDPRNTEVLERPFMCIRRMWIDGCIFMELSPRSHTMNDDLYAAFISIGTAVVHGRHIAGYSAHYKSGYIREISRPSHLVTYPPSYVLTEMPCGCPLPSQLVPPVIPDLLKKNKHWSAAVNKHDPSFFPGLAAKQSPKVSPLLGGGWCCQY